MASSHKYPPWRRAILVPFWTLQLLFMLIMIALLAFAVGILMKYDNNTDYGLGSYDGAVDQAVDASKMYASLSATELLLCANLPAVSAQSGSAYPHSA